MRAAVLTVSDKGSRGERPQDVGGDTTQATLEALGATVVARAVVADEAGAISRAIRSWADGGGIDLVVTTGGTGLAPRDVTPQATLAVLDYEVPGLSEQMRRASLSATPMALLSRAVAGVRGQTLVVNLPGSPKGARECLEAIGAVLPHAIETLRGEAGEHRPPSAGERSGQA